MSPEMSAYIRAQEYLERCIVELDRAELSRNTVRIASARLSVRNARVHRDQIAEADYVPPVLRAV